MYFLTRHAFNHGLAFKSVSVHAFPWTMEANYGSNASENLKMSPKILFIVSIGSNIEY